VISTTGKSDIEKKTLMKPLNDFWFIS